MVSLYSEISHTGHGIWPTPFFGYKKMVLGFLTVSDDVSDQLSRADRLSLFMQATSQLGHLSRIPPEWVTSLGRDNPWLSPRDSGQAGQSIRCQSRCVSKSLPAGTSGFCSSWAHLFSLFIKSRRALTPLVCARSLTPTSPPSRLGRWLGSAPASASSRSTLSNSPGHSCQSDISCSRHLPGVVGAGGDASQVLRLTMNSAVFVESMQKASFADIFIPDAFFCLKSFPKDC